MILPKPGVDFLRVHQAMAWVLQECVEGGCSIRAGTDLESGELAYGLEGYGDPLPVEDINRILDVVEEWDRIVLSN